MNVALGRVLYCLFTMVPLVLLPVLSFRLSTTTGIIMAAVAAVLVVPLLLSTIAHLDLFRAKSRYGLSDDELREFTRLVPFLASQPENAGVPAREAKQTAADIIRERRDGRRRSAARPPSSA